MNDPNGLVYFEGEYHLFFQHNPQGDRWGHLSWGHAVSADLVHWRELDVAIPERDVMIFSGSAVVDWKNSSGFGIDGSPPLVALYTGHHKKTNVQAQYVTFSTDKGRTWTQYDRNPVIDVASRDFRDPKVLWHGPSERWVMVVAHSIERRVSFYNSSNLRDWSETGSFGPAGAIGGVWECPDLFELTADDGARKWVLTVHVNDAAVAGGSGGQYFVGDFDGESFSTASTLSIGQANWIDYGKDFYASQSWSDLPAGDATHIWIGWMANVAYAQDVPTRPWRGAMTLPRSISLLATEHSYLLRQEPIEALKLLRMRDSVREPQTDIAANGLVPIAAATELGDLLEIETVLTPNGAADTGLSFRFGDDELRVGFEARSGHLYVDRSRMRAFARHDFSGKHYVPVELVDGGLAVHLFLDRSSVELFANRGARVVTDLFFSNQPLTTIVAYADGGAASLRDTHIWPLSVIRRN